MILIVNDDGYTSSNLKLLYEYCSSIDEVLLVTSFENHSLKGNVYSLNKNFKVKSIDEGYIINGTPVDCVRFGLSKSSPDLIISGVNNGFNIGRDTLLCSGTFMSAREGYLHNIKSLSCSFEKYKKLDYELLKSVLDEVLQFNFKLANLNIVSDFIMITELCDSMYDYVIEENTVITHNKQKFNFNTDGYAVFNQNNSSLTILK